MTDKAMVTKAMVEAAQEVYSRYGHTGHLRTSPPPPDVVRSMLEAALAQEEQPVAVKPLRWKGPDSSGEYHSLDGLWGYVIRDGNGNGFWLTEVGGYFPTADAAIATAQADYERRILAALALSPSKIEAGENTAETPPPPVTDLSGWSGIKNAPYDTPVKVLAGRMTFIAILRRNASIDCDGEPCDQWQAVIEGEHPPCWTDGACWENNAEDSASLWPEAFQPLSADDRTAIATKGGGE